MNKIGDTDKTFVINKTTSSFYDTFSTSHQLKLLY